MPVLKHYRAKVVFIIEQMKAHASISSITRATRYSAARVKQIYADSQQGEPPERWYFLRAQKGETREQAYQRWNKLGPQTRAYYTADIRKDPNISWEKLSRKPETKVAPKPTPFIIQLAPALTTEELLENEKAAFAQRKEARRQEMHHYTHVVQLKHNQYRERTKDEQDDCAANIKRLEKELKNERRNEQANGFTHARSVATRSRGHSTGSLN